MFIVKPYLDELLSSWFIRLARRNYTSVSTIICYIFKGDALAEHTAKLHIKDIDLFDFNKEQRSLLMQSTGVEIVGLQLHKFEGYLNVKVDRYHRQWIADPKATRHNTKRFFGVRYCPKCLEEKVYIRQLWRILLYNICLKHQCYLLCKCTSCHEKFMYYDNGYLRNIEQCYHCGFDLKKAEVQYVSNIKHIQYQHKLMNILSCGYYKVNRRYFYSIGLFRLLKNLLYTILKNYDFQIKSFKQLEPFQLSRLLSHILFLLEHFPRRLNRYYRKKGLTDITNILSWNDRNMRLSELPAWYLAGIEYRVITKRGKRI